jgi:hypothetical protein
VLKARAIHLREKPKDAFDLHYILVNFEGGVDAIATELRSLLDDLDAVESLRFLRQAYGSIDGIGPSRAAYFLYGTRDRYSSEDYDTLAASAYAFVTRLLTMIDK